MEVALRDSWHARDLLGEVRAALDGADEALLCVAFARLGGVQLLEPQLRRLGERARLVVTTTLGDSGPALARASTYGTRIRFLNPAGGTYHPKLYLARRGDRIWSFIGSPNLTSGLVGNIELGIAARGASDELPGDAWRLGDALWLDARARDWTGIAVAPEPVPEQLRRLVDAAVRPGDVVATLSGDRPNRVVSVGDEGIRVETTRSRERGELPQLVEWWMVEVGWTALAAQGRLRNRALLDDLRVHRSSFVCGLLARFPGVRVVSRSPIELAWDPEASSG